MFTFGPVLKIRMNFSETHSPRARNRLAPHAGAHIESTGPIYIYMYVYVRVREERPSSTAQSTRGERNNRVMPVRRLPNGTRARTAGVYRDNQSPLGTSYHTVVVGAGGGGIRSTLKSNNAY